MFFNFRSRRSPNPIYYCVNFLSPYFILYVKCPRTRFWQLARTQEEATRVVDGTTEIHTHPVLLFSSRSEAEDYATALGLEPKKVSFHESELFAFWRQVERFEAVNLPEETIQIQKTLSVAPTVYVKEVTPTGSVVTLSIADRKRE